MISVGCRRLSEGERLGFSFVHAADAWALVFASDVGAERNVGIWFF